VDNSVAGYVDWIGYFGLVSFFKPISKVRGEVKAADMIFILEVYIKQYGLSNPILTSLNNTQVHWLDQYITKSLSR